ncbi:MAG TPA: PilZ domain-containing protein [Geminicoccus sp.]|jgi:hypothetical protein|uniref:PilZ domain-containing protein n=1 Tax=Geminicoccus sp. TaxID=2024832 RepID=UPI002E35B5C0|nr:PilZ domain-containing protein [Geminicoccus sp.]HEX2528083.1 PilZ domain-containing protein [Geminicoccus sp.]
MSQIEGESEGSPPAELPSANERRYHRRFPSGLPAKVDIEGAVRPVTILDLSLGGAGLAPAFPAIVGASVGLDIQGMLPRRTIEARVLSVSRHRTHLLFNCTHEEQTALIYFLLGAAEEA